jgi:hypothetical protein
VQGGGSAWDRALELLDSMHLIQSLEGEVLSGGGGGQHSYHIEVLVGKEGFHHCCTACTSCRACEARG